jgi:hypothetical protein
MVIRIFICRKQMAVIYRCLTMEELLRRVIYALITNMEAVRENYGNSECNN